MLIKKNLSRRRVLRGILNGGVVSVGLPLLDCFLNDGGTAYASGAPMPVRFGTWFWGLGGNNSILVPQGTGTNYEIPQQLAPVARVREHVNMITNLTAFRDGEPNLCHYSGWIIGRTGKAPAGSAERPGETIDVTIANELGRSTRFRTLTASATGDFRSTVSYENANSPNPPEISPLEFYSRLYGADFQDPNSPVFTPSPRVMARRSVLSGVMDEIKSMEKTVRRHRSPAARRILHRPAPSRKAVRPAAHQARADRGLPCAADHHPGSEDGRGRRHGAEAPSHADRPHGDGGGLRPDPRLQHVVLERAGEHGQGRLRKSRTTRPRTKSRSIRTWAISPTTPTSFRVRSKNGLTSSRPSPRFAKAAAPCSTTLLIYANTDHGDARVHALDKLVSFTAGRAGGRVKTGMHIDAGGSGVTRVGYTALKVMGLEIPAWGVKSNRTSSHFSEIIA